MPQIYNFEFVSHTLKDKEHKKIKFQLKNFISEKYGGMAAGKNRTQP